MLDYDDALYKNYTKFALSKYNDQYREVTKAIVWDKTTDATSSSYITGFANIIDNFKPGEIYNFGGEKQYEIKYVSDLILSCLDKNDSNVTYRDVEPFTTKIKTPDSSKAKEDLDFNLSTSLEEGIPLTIKWFKELYSTKTDDY